MAGLLAVLGMGWLMYRASQAERAARDSVREENSLRYTVQDLDPVLPQGWETFASPSDYRDAAIWQGSLYVAGANALFRFAADGTLDKVWRSGFELPPAPLARLSAGDELWIATDGGGAISFNGQRMRRILPDKRGGARIRDVLPLGTGGVALGSDGMGVLRFDAAGLRIMHPALAGLSVTSLAGEETDLWVGTRDAGVVHLRGGHAERFGEAEGLPDKAVHAVAAEGDRAFAGTSTGIAEFRGGRFVRVIAAGVLAKSLKVRGGELLAGTLNDGWLRISLDGRPGRRAEADSSEVRRVFAEGEDLYVVRPDSVDVIRGGKAMRALQAGTALLTHGNVSALAMGADGRLWVGFFDRGIDIVAPDRRGNTHVEDERVFCVNRIRQSGEGQGMAVATANGLVFFDSAGRQRQVMTRQEGLIASHITDLAARGRGWVAATPAGLTFIDGGTRSVYAFQGLVNNHVYAVGVSGEQVAAGTLGGVSLLKGENVARSFTTANSGLKTNWVTALARVGEDWFAGTYGGGVQKMDASGNWQTFDSMPANVVVNPNAMVATGRAVYAGTLEHGLMAWDFGGQSWRSVRMGLPSLNVTAILYHDNKLYLGTDNGLVVAPESGMGL